MAQSYAQALSAVPRSQGLAATFARAFEYARAQAHRSVTLEHLLLALAEDPDAVAVLQASQIDLGRLSGDVSGHLGRLEDRVEPGHPVAPAADPDLLRILDYAAAAARQSRRREINGAIVLAAIVGDGKSTSANILRAQGLTFEAAIRALQRGAAESLSVAPPQAPAEPARPQHGPGPAAPPSTDEILASVRRRISESRTGPQAAGLAPRQHPATAPPAPAAAAQPSGSPYPEPPQPMAPAGSPPDGADARAMEDGAAGHGWAPPPDLGPNSAAGWAVRRPPPLPPMPSAPLAPAVPHAPSSGTEAYPPGAALQGDHLNRHQGAGAPWPEAATAPMSAEPQPVVLTHGYAPDMLPAGAPYPPVDHPRSPLVPTTAGGPSRPPAAAPRRAATLVLEPGQIMESVPRTLRVASGAAAEVRIAKVAIRELGASRDGAGSTQRDDLVVAKAMTVRLRAPNGRLFVEPVTPETQWIDGSGGFMSDDHASWRWIITPRRRGRARLAIACSARTVGIDGLTAEAVLPELPIDVVVRTDWRHAATRLGGWLVAALVGGVAALFGAPILWAALVLLGRLTG
jgi:hypothetical protein